MGIFFPNHLKLSISDSFRVHRILIYTKLDMLWKAMLYAKYKSLKLQVLLNNCYSQFQF